MNVKINVDQYTFVVDKETMRHLRRHFREGDGTKGSVFRNNVFPTISDGIRYAFEQLRKEGYDGSRTVIERDYKTIVGSDAVIPVDELPDGAEIRQEERDGRRVTVAYGAKPISTRHIVMVFGPIEDDRHTIYTMFPGKNTPPLPVDDKQLEQWYKNPEELEKAREINEKAREFWGTHAFVKPN